MITELVTLRELPSLLTEPPRTSRFTAEDGYHIDQDGDAFVVGHRTVEGRLLVVPVAACQYALWRKDVGAAPQGVPVSASDPEQGPLPGRAATKTGVIPRKGKR